MTTTALTVQPYISAATPNLAQYILDAVQNFPTNYMYTLGDFISILTNFANDNEEIFLQLSTSRPDYESIKQQLIADLSTRDAWKDIITASGGGTVIDFVAAVGAYGQAGISTALQETNLDTASLVSSVNLIMRMLGVHILRKTPGKQAVTITSTFAADYGAKYGNVLIIPSFTQFYVGGVYLFNDTPLTFEAGVISLNTVLREGQVSDYVILSTGYPFQKFEIGNNDYSISDTDIYCFQPDGTEFTRITDGLYKYNAKSMVFYENTTAEGNVEIIFGNDLYGTIPETNSVLAFIYVNTLGSKANTTISGNIGNIKNFCAYVPDRINLQTDEATAAYQAAVIASVVVTTTTGVYSGDDERDNEFYRAVGPFLGSGRKGMIRKQEHYAKGLAFPGIADILFRNQKDIAPYNRNLINCVYVTPLMKNGLLMSDAIWNDFVDYLALNQIWRVEWVLFQPRKIPLDISGTLYCSLDSNKTNVETYAVSALRQAYGIRRGSLGNSLYLSDLTSYLSLNFQNIKVDYIEYNSPLDNILILPTDYLYINTLNLNVEFSQRNYQTYSPASPESYIPI